MIAIAVVQALLFGDATPPDCAKHVDPIACLVDTRFSKDERAKQLAEELYSHSGDIASLGSDEQMNGGYRGMIHHVNDEGHKDWSQHTLATDHKAIVKKCGTRSSCLAPYAPNDTKVRATATGTYYAFQPNNGNTVHEYAAELAVRYFKEQAEVLAHGRLSHRAFKCGPPENGRAWHALADEFFAGVDRVPTC